MELADEKEAIAQFGSSDSGASLGDILGAALKDKNEAIRPLPGGTDKARRATRAGPFSF